MENPYLAGQEKKIWLRNGGIALAGLVIGWVKFLPLVTSNEASWEVGVGVSIFIVIFMAWITTRELSMFRNGVPVIGIVQSHKFGGFFVKLKPMMVEYAVLGETHVIKLDALAKDYPVGSQIVLLYDNRNPKKIVKASDLLKGEALAFAKQEAEKTFGRSF